MSFSSFPLHACSHSRPSFDIGFHISPEWENEAAGCSFCEHLRAIIVREARGRNTANPSIHSEMALSLGVACMEIIEWKERHEGGSVQLTDVTAGDLDDVLALLRCYPHSRLYYIPDERSAAEWAARLAFWRVHISAYDAEHRRAEEEEN